MFVNVENLFSPGHSFYGTEYTLEEYKTKIAWIGDKIAEAQVHVVGLSEIGADAQVCLDDLMASANHFDKTGWQPFAHGFGANPGSYGAAIRTAVISRFPLSDEGSLDQYPDGFFVDLYQPPAGGVGGQWLAVPSRGYSRPIASVRVNPPNGGRAFNLLVVHLKSKRPKMGSPGTDSEAKGIARSAIQRNIEAAALRTYLDTFLPNQYETDSAVASIVLGDLNDVPTSVPMENIRGPFDRRPGPPTNWSNRDKRRLLSCARLHQKLVAYEDRLYSYVHNESFSLLDHAFVSEHLVSKFSRLELHNDHVFRHQEISEDTDEDKQWKSQVSDHGLVVLELKNMLA
jgi:predicted extracellular nuclease